MIDIVSNEKLRGLFDKVVHISIFISLFVFALETVQELNDYEVYFEVIELCSIFVFTIEYILRIYAAYKQKEVWHYVTSFMGIIDVASILPLFIPAIIGIDLRFVKIFRLFSVFRIFKLYRYSAHLQAIIRVVVSKKDDLIATLFSILIVLIFCSCLAYYFEKDTQPEIFSNIFQSMYWGISTLATIGYGDIYPMTIGGKLTATILAMLGIGLITIPSAILSAGFIEEIQNRRTIKISFTPPKDIAKISLNDNHKAARQHKTSPPVPSQETSEVE